MTKDLRVVTRSLTIEDAKRVQQLTEHLTVIRRARRLLLNRKIETHTVHLKVRMYENELPPNVRAEYRAKNKYNNDGIWDVKLGAHFHRDRDDSGYWTASATINYEPLRVWGVGHYATLPTEDGTDIADVIRGHVDKEIARVEAIITGFGFMLPPEEK